MNKILIVLVLFISSFSLLSAQEIIKVASYNIKYLNADIETERKRNLAKVIEELDADIFGLQEISDRKALENIFLPDEWHIIIDDDSGVSQDLALVVNKRFNIKNFSGSKLDADDKHFMFPHADNKFFPNRRDILSIEIELPNSSNSFFVMVVHAKARYGGRHNTEHQRVGAAKAMIKVLEREFDDKDFILLGDFNDSPDDASLNILESGNPNMPAAKENSKGPFLVNLAEPLFAVDHVTFGRNNSDRLETHKEKISTIRPGIRELNISTIESNENIGDCLFDQILIPISMQEKYVIGSFEIFDGASSVNGNNKTRASDHLPVFAEFIFSDDINVELPNKPLSIVEVLPNPEGIDTDNEYIIIQNNMDSIIDLTGYYLKDRAENTYELSGNIKAKNKTKVILKGNKMPLNNSGDLVILFDKDQEVIDEILYESHQVSIGIPVIF